MTTTLEAIPNGDAGTAVTLRRMSALARRDALDPVVRQLAVQVTGRCGEHAVACHVRQLRAWLARAVRFVRDPLTVELIQAPRVLAAQLVAGERPAGDCDDVATLGAALGRSVGLAARFVVLGFFRRGGPWSHVYVELREPLTGQWYDLDVTRRGGRLPASRIGTFPV